MTLDADDIHAIALRAIAAVLRNLNTDEFATVKANLTPENRNRKNAVDYRIGVLAWAAQQEWRAEARREEQQAMPVAEPYDDLQSAENFD